MKYIKTQKELYKVMQKQICNTDKFVEVQRKKVGLFTGTTELISKDDIIGLADTIEELCDQLVYVEDTIPENIYPALMNPKGIIQSQIALGCTKVYKIENFKYGIWTKKGLTYVAEFNDKGELELI